MIQEIAKFYDKSTACFGNLNEFEQKIRQIAQICGIPLEQYEIDHLAVRVNSVEKAKIWRETLLGSGQMLKESEINGRPIALIQLDSAVTFCGQDVKIIELPFPKDKIYPQEGWEHCELVFPFLAHESVELWIARCLAFFQLETNPEIQLKISQPKANGEQLANPTIAITLKNATYCNFYCLKLHPYGINTVIRSEQCSD